MMVAGREERRLEIVIIGAGVAGVAAAYGLAKEPNVYLRVFERRKEEECMKGGYPLHLTLIDFQEARESLASLLDRKDYTDFLKASASFPGAHDGATIINSKGKIIWRTRAEPGERSLIERRHLCQILGDSILRSSNVQVEYEKGVRSIARLGRKGWEITLWNGEIATCNLLIGRHFPLSADGMYSGVRLELYPPTPGIPDTFRPLPWTTVNIRATSNNVKRWLRDPRGMNIILGRGWSAVALGLPSRSITVGSLPYSPTSFRSKFGGQEATMTVEKGGGTYVALTLPHPQGPVREALHALPDSSSPDSLIRALLDDHGIVSAMAFPIWRARKTVVGRDGAVLIGDASHGMTPFKGAGASAGIVDAVHLVQAIRKHLVFGDRLNVRLERFYKNQVERNDPLIKDSTRALWVAQGENWVKRAIRRTIFFACELLDSIGSKRAETDHLFGRLVV